MKNSEFRLETVAIHGGQSPDPVTGSRAVPIYQTTAYAFQDTEHARRLFALEEPGNIYTRIGNPTTDVLEQRVAMLEGGVGALAFASGHAAISAAIMNICSAGDEIVTSSRLYGGTYNLFATTLPKYGITAKFVDPSDPENFRRAITDRTRAVFGETIGNPRLDVFDIEAIAKIAHEHGIPLIIDNTFASPALCRPIEWGADIVVHSATKWMGGHGVAMGGVVVDGGHFYWNSPKFPGFTEPDPSYHGVRYGADFGAAGYITKLRTQLMRDLGAAPSPFNSFLLLLGLETLPLRMRAHSENAMALARFLEKHPGVEWVQYPGLTGHASFNLAVKYLSGGFGGMLVFGVKGGVEAGARFIDGLKLFSHLANVGDAKSLVIHPASTTHSQLTPEQRAAAGVGDDLIRISAGLENAADLIADLERGLSAAAGAIGRAAAGGLAAAPTLNDESVIRWAAGESTVGEGGAERPKVLAVVGLSDNVERPAYEVAEEMQKLGYRIVPVNPTKTGEILGEPVYNSLADIPFPVDVVDVFRAPEHVMGVFREMQQMQHKPSVFWLQEGVINQEAAEAAMAEGIQVVMDHCLWKAARRVRAEQKA